MDVNDLRILFTVLSLLAFLGILAWVGLARNRAGFEEAARLPFADDTPDAAP
jgi:cytochrome c oxidase cbb3-type subunit IV